MAWTQTDIDRLKAAMSSAGSISAMTFGDQSFTFRSISDMQALLADMQVEVSAANPSSTFAPTRFASVSKGV
jgi:hypothetical protein